MGCAASINESDTAIDGSEYRNTYVVSHASRTSSIFVTPEWIPTSNVGRAFMQRCLCSSEEVLVCGTVDVHDEMPHSVAEFIAEVLPILLCTKLQRHKKVEQAMHDSFYFVNQMMNDMELTQSDLFWGGANAICTVITSTSVNFGTCGNCQGMLLEEVEGNVSILYSTVESNAEGFGFEHVVDNRRRSSLNLQVSGGSLRTVRCIGSHDIPRSDVALSINCIDIMHRGEIKVLMASYGLWGAVPLEIVMRSLFGSSREHNAALQGVSSCAFLCEEAMDIWKRRQHLCPCVTLILAEQVNSLTLWSSW